MKIGLIGRGFVGDAIYQNLKNDHDFLVYDIDDDKKNVSNIRDVIHGAKIIFVALPPPIVTGKPLPINPIFIISPN